MENKKKILFSGIFDNQLARYAKWLKENSIEAVECIGLSSEVYPDACMDTWRLASLINKDEIIPLLDDIDAAYWFCLSPIKSEMLEAGNAWDVFLLSAIQFARAAKASIARGTLKNAFHVILVIRYFPHDFVNFGKFYNRLLQIYNIYHIHSDSFKIIQIMPVLSLSDDITAGMTAYATAHSNPKRETVEWLNLTRPLTEREFFCGLSSALSSKKQHFILEGASIVSYEEWLETIQHQLRGVHVAFLPHALNSISPTLKQRLDLLKETLNFHTFVSEHENDQESRPSFNAKIAHMLENYSKYTSLQMRLSVSNLLSRTNCASELPHTACRYVYGMQRSKRNLADTANLLMHWIPKFFKNTLNIEDVSQTRMACKFSNHSVFEIEKHSESPEYCKLLLHLPWSNTPDGHLKLIIAGSPNSEQTHGTLLIALSNAPNWTLCRILFFNFVKSFGKFLKQFG